MQFNSKMTMFLFYSQWLYVIPVCHVGSYHVKYTGHYHALKPMDRTFAIETNGQHPLSK